MKVKAKAKATILNGALPGEGFIDAVQDALQDSAAEPGLGRHALDPTRRKARLLPGLLRVLDQDARLVPHRRRWPGRPASVIAAI